MGFARSARFDSVHFARFAYFACPACSVLAAALGRFAALAVGVAAGASMAL